MKIGRSPLIAIGLALLAGGWAASGQIGNGANGAEQATAPAADETESRRASVRVADLVALPRMEIVSITGRTQASRTVELRAETEAKSSKSSPSAVTWSAKTTLSRGCVWTTGAPSSPRPRLF